VAEAEVIGALRDERLSLRKALRAGPRSPVDALQCPSGEGSAAATSKEERPGSDSSGLPIIVLQEPAQPLAAMDRALGDLGGRLFLAEAAQPRVADAAVAYRVLFGPRRSIVCRRIGVQRATNEFG